MQCMDNSGCVPRGKQAVIVRHYPVFVVFLCAVFAYFRNPLNSGTDYRIFNVCAYVISRMRA